MIQSRIFNGFLAGLVVLIVGAGASAEPQPPLPATRPATKPAEGNKRDAKPEPKPEAKPGAGDDKLSVTSGQVTLGGQVVKYTATTGTMVMKDEAGKPRANFFFVAYKREVPHYDPAKRPITFVFNGGPGAAAVWLHLGAVGPRRVELDEQGGVVGPPHRLVDNQASWLDLTDLVFIDPVGTGYSRAADGVKPEEFYGVQNDIHSVGDFIRLYTTRNDRWLSPKFLAGESYGTTRAAGLSEYLMERFGIDVNGIIFISSVLDFQTILFNGGDVPYICYLPTYAATAWHHKKLDAEYLKMDLAELVAEVQAWAVGDYAAALAAGSALNTAVHAEVVKKLAAYTGMPADLIDRASLRIAPEIFRKNLLATERRVIGRFDARVSGDDANPASNDSVEFDPSFDGYFSVYTSTVTDYIRRVLKFESDLPYETLSGKGGWGFERGGRGYLETASSLASAMRKNPRLKALFCSGYFDLATPTLCTDYTLAHMDLSKAARANITRAFFGAGHMVYHRKADLEKLKQDVKTFIESASGVKE